MYYFIIFALIFLFGLAIGSFLNVVIYRTLHGESPMEGRSKCPRCKKKIRAVDNIPLISYMMLRGKCRDCRERIAWTYPVIEFLTGALFVWWFIAGSFFFRLSQSPFVYIQPLFWLLVGLILITITFSDLIYGLIPDFLVVILGVLALVYRLLLTASGIMQKGDFWFSIYSAVGAFLFFMVLIIATRNRGMGMGDAKLSISLGLLLGWPRVVVGFFTSFMLGAIFALILIVSGKKRFGQTIAFGPFMVLGSFIALVWGSKIWSYYLSFLY